MSDQRNKSDETQINGGSALGADLEELDLESVFGGGGGGGGLAEFTQTDYNGGDRDYGK